MNKNLPETDAANKILTIPNLLSFFRLLLIPVFVYCYTSAENYKLAAAVIILSGISDIADGFIARRFNMVSNAGKILDPFADKLTQAFMLLCLLGRFPLMLIPLLIMTIKELSTGVYALFVVRKTKCIQSSDWHGKLNTVLLYAVMLLHILWPAIPHSVSASLIALCVCTMLLSFVLYTLRNYNSVKAYKNAV